ncbi:hypothetical protein BHM03_00003299 [Ensete ventricosum]|nr:hypothetical protein BHM03_00003299 [Ensete ventricosum]
MFNWVQATVVGFQHWEAEIGRNRFVLNFRGEWSGCNAWGIACRGASGCASCGICGNPRIHCQRGEPRVIEQPPVAVWGECRQVPFIGRWEKARASRAESLGGRGSLLPEAFLIDVVLWVLLQHLIPPSSTKIIVELYVVSEESARLSSNRMRKLVGVGRSGQVGSLEEVIWACSGMLLGVRREIPHKGLVGVGCAQCGPSDDQVSAMTEIV